MSTGPKTRKRRRRAFNRKKDAEAFRNTLLLKVAEGNYVDERTAPTVSKGTDHWLGTKEGSVKASTLKGYKVVVNGAIRGPLLIGTKQERADYTESGIAPKDARFLKMLGDVKLTDLTTAMIRVWYKTLIEQCGNYTANRAKSHLKSILALAEEDFGIRAPSMPTGLPRMRNKQKKAILTPDHIAKLITAAKDDPEHGIYYSFPFLAGTRPSEQLGLLWSEVDFDKNVIHICRIQERDGSLTEMTKTEAGTRDIPMGVTLREMLLAWRVRCPRKGKELHRVFPGPGRLQEWPLPRLGGGGPLLYSLFGPDDVARTLSARYYKDGSEVLIDQPGKRPRRLTPLECARLMGFDRGDRRFRIEVSDTQAYRQFGNAVVVPVVEFVAQAMKSHIQTALAASGEYPVLSGPARAVTRPVSPLAAVHA